MTTITYDAAPSLTFDAFEAPHGALLLQPTILLDVDSLPGHRRIDKAASFVANLDFGVNPFEPFSTEWRACTPGSPVVVETVATCEWTSVYVECSADGTNAAESALVGNLLANLAVGFRFTTSKSFYRVTLCGSNLPYRAKLWTQQRG